MFTRLEKTYEPHRAQIAAGVLRTHGIAAWVTGDVSSSSYGTIASGGCSLMVDETELEEAQRILDAHPLPETGVEPPTGPAAWKPLTLWGSLGNGALQGAFWLPALTLALYALIRVIGVLTGSSMIMHPDDFSVFHKGFVRGTLKLSVTGALIGVIAGLAAWLLSSYRHHGRVGLAFVLLIVLLVATPGALLFVW